MKLHLGCGKRYMPGFIHVDIDPQPHVDYVGNVSNLSFLRDNCVEYIYASHILEYFGKNEVRSVLHEWHRVLQPGGLLRLAVPNFKILARLYLESKVPVEFVSGVLYGHMEIGDQNIYHKACYNYDSLWGLLNEKGFTNIRLWDWREVEDIPTDDWARSYVPHMDFENGTLISLNMEAVKNAR